MRAADVVNLRLGGLQLTDSPPQIRWIGKARRSRRVVPGEVLLELLGRYLRTYRTGAGPELPSDGPVVCRGKPGAGTGRVAWGHGIARTCSVQVIVRNRAAAAGLGHMSPHDLRRTTAGILHRAKSADGGHLFDLRDIQQVLDHADPATTGRASREGCSAQPACSAVSRAPVATG